MRGAPLALSRGADVPHVDLEADRRLSVPERGIDEPRCGPLHHADHARRREHLGRQRAADVGQQPTVDARTLPSPPFLRGVSRSWRARELGGRVVVAEPSVPFIESGPMSDLPAQVRIREVGPRDGFQNEPEVIPTADKVRLIELLGATGLRRIEVTSFVRPDVIPQLADASEVLVVGLAAAGGRGQRADPERAWARAGAAARVIGFRRSTASCRRPRRHNQKNVGRSVAESLAGLERTFARALAEGLRCEGVISTSFGCPYEGHVPVDRVLDIASALVDAGAVEVGFGDTTGMANPVQVRDVLRGGRRAAAGRRADRPLPQHPRPGARERAGGARSGRRELRVELRRARRLSGAGRARPATSRPRTWCRCCTRWGSRPGSTSAR